MAISPYTNETQTRWDRGDFKAMVKSETSDRPIGFCEGTEADEAEILEMAGNEGAEVEIDKKALKTGREVWTVRALS